MMKIVWIGNSVETWLGCGAIFLACFALLVLARWALVRKFRSAERASEAS